MADQLKKTLISKIKQALPVWKVKKKDQKNRQPNLQKICIIILDLQCKNGIHKGQHIDSHKLVKKMLTKWVYQELKNLVKINIF